MNFDRINEIVEEALESRPIPSRLSDLDRSSRERIERAAALSGITPQQHLDEVTRSIASHRDWDASVGAIIAEVRMRR